HCPEILLTRKQNLNSTINHSSDDLLGFSAQPTLAIFCVYYIREFLYLYYIARGNIQPIKPRGSSQ
ncbi:hypothetical protein MJ258_17355, partial [Legionella sp. EUR-108]|uniref:hypothetical protein n=1 Tax=Legionella maioricensis TaxID=2896528 RepID=UPI0020287B51